MKWYERLASILEKAITSLYIVLGCTVFGAVIGLIIYEIIWSSIFVLIGCGVAGLLFGIIVASDSNRIGFFNFIKKVSATNELYDPELVKEFYKMKKPNKKKESSN